MIRLRSDHLLLCDIQGKIFEKSAAKGFASEQFIEAYMNSVVAQRMDKIYDHLQWAGESYIFAELIDELPLEEFEGEVFDPEVMYWTGYVYRYWHYYTGENSKEIYKAADAETMNLNWLGLHTMSIEMAIDDLKEMHAQKESLNRKPTLDQRIAIAEEALDYVTEKIDFNRCLE